MQNAEYRVGHPLGEFRRWSVLVLTVFLLPGCVMFRPGSMEEMEFVERAERDLLTVVGESGRKPADNADAAGRAVTRRERGRVAGDDQPLTEPDRHDLPVVEIAGVLVQRVLSEHLST